ncbi:hypothetical protein MYSTI_01952 [Myxococcus stipitatus DSM 14675]|uniref:DUF3850 domain-containing protein n=1 Tax=Myxococcus stipitatus (strain DSM 14675 / JCM 12634 / Mx s8) TaxID=1278073 RepID=L7U3C0_MYXSD|nr:ASCH/PUA domain-containing protein [Myxococcus stipitatus]AGC43281.1 hypothetical protein MYSTI_01952 [Myxococcus stipitatus DSM 14675]
MKHHDLKTWPPYFQDVMTGVKSFELRENDRDFAVGDTLCLREWDPQVSQYTMRAVTRRVVYVLPGGAFGLASTHVILGLGSI